MRKVKSEREVGQSCLTLSDPMDYSLPGSSIHGIFQARVLEWGAIAFSTELHKSLQTPVHARMTGDVLQFCNCMIPVHASCGLNGWSACWSISASAMVPKLTWDNVYVRRRQWHPTPVLLPGKSHGRRSLVGCIHGVTKSRTRLSDCTFTFHFHALEKEMAAHSCSCLENPRDGGACWAPVYGVGWGRTRLKRLSSSSDVYVVKCLVQSPEHRHDYGYLIISIYLQRIHRLCGWHSYTLALIEFPIQSPVNKFQKQYAKHPWERLPAAQHPLKVCESRLSCLLAVTETALCPPIPSSLPPHWHGTGFTLAGDVCAKELHFWPPSQWGGTKSCK